MDDTPIHASLREALANALIHEDYYGRCGIVIDKEFRKITISNPGTFRISIDAAIAGGISDARNSRIFNMFSLIDIGERAGSGLCDLYNNWKEFGYKTPVLLETVDPDRISLTLEIEPDGKNEGVNDGVNDGVNEGDGRNNGKYPDLNKTQHLVLAELQKNPSTTAATIANATGLSKSTIERAIAELKKREYIARKGSAKTGKWLILK